MNFFAHYYYGRQEGNYWHNAGLLFPDLLRIFTGKQRVNSRGLNKLVNYNTELVSGIRNHLHVDAVFHDWKWFLDMNHEIALKIRSSDSDINRDWFVAHIFIELAIDHVLVTDNLPLVESLYSDLEMCDEIGWYQFFDEYTLKDKDKWIMGLSKFIEYRYIFTYQDTTKIIYALNRICQRTGLSDFNEQQSEFLLLILKDFIPEIKIRLKELQNILK